MENNGHITDLQWELFYAHKMRREEMLKFFTHIAHCDYCADRMKEEMPTDSIMRAPNGMEEEILGRVKKHKKEFAMKKGRNRELVMYGLRVGVSVAMAIFLMFALSSKQMVGVEMINGRKPFEKKESYTVVLTQGLNDFSNKVTDGLNMLVDFSNDKLKIGGKKNE